MESILTSNHEHKRMLKTRRDLDEEYRYYVVLMAVLFQNKCGRNKREMMMK
jgi:hypothetical protein